MRVLKTIVKYGGIFCGVCLLICLTLITSSCIPRENIEEQLKESAIFLKEKNGIEELERVRYDKIIHYYYNTKISKFKGFLRKSSQRRKENTIYSTAGVFRDTKYGCQDTKTVPMIDIRARKCYNKINNKTFGRTDGYGRQKTACLYNDGYPEIRYGQLL